MKHLTIVDLGDGFIKITPKKGYKLYSLLLQREVSEAVVKENQLKQFEAIKAK